ncbi:MAG: hypothetical protein R8M45_03590 [Ghiorsea sp.]
MEVYIIDCEVCGGSAKVSFSMDEDRYAIETCPFCGDSAELITEKLTEIGS